ncbi:MAG: P63C domain-containing protein [Verrucomicrobiaceae bacterium]|nr:P63C domain-containing protein [Verrucomicrobiaceae bacterium]
MNKSDFNENSLQSQGGKARAAKLSPEQRSEIAATAAAKRWSLPRASHEGNIHIGEITIQSAVLEDGRRVLTQSDFMIALGRSRQAKGRAYYAGDVNLPVFLTAQNLKPFIDSELHVTSSQIEFKPLKGARAFGYPADLLPKVCEVFLKARDAGVLVAGQTHIARQADVLMRGLAHIGIIALVDEATGYQDVRDRQALQTILEKYITDEWARWTRRFDPEFYKQLFRLRGIPFPPSTGTRKPSYVGHWTNDIVYARLAPGILKKLKEVNPRATSGSRSRKHHQHLTEDIGAPELQQHLSNIIFLMRTCTNWEEFKTKLDIASPKFGDTMALNLTD